jgi:hypothetical protein
MYLEILCMEEWSKISPNVFSNLNKHFRKRLCYPRNGSSTEKKGANNYGPDCVIFVHAIV